jgi:protein tyrosine/serine phosphatase
VRSRDLAWDGCLNVRDLGGHVTEDGVETRWGSVIRSDSVRTLSEAGWDALVAHGVARIVDLRSHGEREEDPPHEVPVEVVHVSVMAEHDDAVWQEIERAADGEPERETEVFYLESLRRWGDRFAEAIAAVADAPDAPVVVHCRGGRDRTGIVAALLLRLAGVALADAAADYALSSAKLEPHWRRWVDDAPDEAERERRLRFSATPAATMLAVLEALEREHGSVAGFLREHGVSDETVARARARLRP